MSSKCKPLGQLTTLVAVTSAAFAASAQDVMLEEIVVTAQRKEESIQDVPIAVSAFNANEMIKRRIDDARDLQTAVPNLNYTGSGVAGGEGFQIRGVGNNVGGTTGDVGVGIHHNNAPQVQSRIVTAESYDLERVEVLRGPQGTLYGRNATGGVINYITAKPVYEEYDFSVGLEVGSYSSRKATAAINIPFGDAWALRIAAMNLERNGYTDNLATGEDIDDRDLWSARVTLGFEPSDWFRGWVLYEKFDEQDSRRSGARTLCISDSGPSQVGSTPVSAAARNYLSQGCAAGSIYQDAAYAHPHSYGTFGGRFASLLAGAVVPAGDLYAAQMQSTDLRETSEYRNPTTDVEHEIVEFEVQVDLSAALTLSWLGHDSKDSAYLTNGSYQGSIGFLDTPITPGGVFTDFQSGPATGMLTYNIFDFNTEQRSHELRLQSSFDGAVNFNFGLLSFDVERSQHTWVSTNTTTLFIAANYCAGGITGCPIYHDQNPVPDYTGHQYFDTWTPYQLTSRAAFGELYVDLSDTVKLTTGLRYTDDEKERLSLTPQLLQPVGEGGVGTGGYPANAQRIDKVDFQEWTGRLVVDWMPEAGFSDSTLVYASYSRGYKAGGFDSPDVAANAQPYAPEFVNAFEIGTKNILSGGMAQLNASLFYYDYKDYQISKIEGFSARNENIDAEVFGIELESSIEVIDNLVLFGNLGWLKTEIQSGESVDPLNRTNGDPNFTALKGYRMGCIAPTAQVETLLQTINAAGPAAAVWLFDLCEQGVAATLPPAALIPDVSNGIAMDLAGNELPNAPEWSTVVGLEYNWALGSWDAVARLDYSWKDDSYVSVFNGESYELESWDNANFTLGFSNINADLDVQFFVKNLFNEDTVVNYVTGSDGVGLVRNLTLLDPRLFGLNVAYRF